MQSVALGFGSFYLRHLRNLRKALRFSNLCQSVQSVASGFGFLHLRNLRNLRMRGFRVFNLCNLWLRGWRSSDSRQDLWKDGSGSGVEDNVRNQIHRGGVHVDDDEPGPRGVRDLGDCRRRMHGERAAYRDQ